MSPAVLTALGLLLLISAVMFALGFFVGRHNERSAVVAWLTRIPPNSRAPASTWGSGIEKGAHRLAQRLRS